MRTWIMVLVPCVMFLAELGVGPLTALTKTDGGWLVLYSKLGHNHKT